MSVALKSEVKLDRIEDAVLNKQMEVRQEESVLVFPVDKLETGMGR